MSGPTFGFDLDYVKDPEARDGFSKFILALQVFVAQFTPTEIPYDAGNLYVATTPAAPILVKIDSNSYHYNYRVVGDMMTVEIQYGLLAIPAGNFWLFLKLPENYRVFQETWGPAYVNDNNGGAGGFFKAVAGEDRIRVARATFVNWSNTAGAYTSGFGGTFQFKVYRA